MVVCLSAIIMVLGLSTLTTSSEKSDKKMTILFTNDLHDHFMPFEINQNGTVYQVGGYALLQSAISVQKKLNPDLLLIDAGDFSMAHSFSRSMLVTDLNLE